MFKAFIASVGILFLAMLPAIVFGQTLQEVNSMLQGQIFKYTFVIDNQPAEEEWNGPTLIEFIEEGNAIIIEKPNIGAVEFMYAADGWQVTEKNGITLLTIKGEREIPIEIDKITETKISGKYMGDVPGNSGPSQKEPEVRVDIDLVHPQILSRNGLITGHWHVARDDENPSKFTELNIEENGNYNMLGSEENQTGTWKLSPSGRYFSVSHSETENIIFRVENLSEDKMELLQGHYYRSMQIKFEKRL